MCLVKLAILCIILLMSIIFANYNIQSTSRRLCNLTFILLAVSVKLNLKKNRVNNLNLIIFISFKTFICSLCFLMITAFIIIELILCKLIANNTLFKFEINNSLLRELNTFTNALNGRWIGLIIFLISNIFTGFINLTIRNTKFVGDNTSLAIISFYIFLTYLIGYKIDQFINKPK